MKKLNTPTVALISAFVILAILFALSDASLVSDAPADEFHPELQEAKDSTVLVDTVKDIK